jgi:hypothetical protein
MLIVVIALPLIIVGLLLYFTLVLRRFLTEVPSIQSEEHLARFKREVARQMYGTLASGALVVIEVVAFGIGLYHGDLTRGDLWYIAPICVLAGAVGAVLWGVEKQAKTVPAADHLRAERDRVVRVWNRQALPDW